MDRSTARRKTSIRKHRQRISTLLMVVGYVCLTLAALISLAALSRLEFEQARFFHLGMYYLAGGGFFLILHFFCFILPDKIKERQSGVLNRRRAQSKSYHRPKPTHGIIQSGEEGGILILVLVLLGIISAISLQVIVSVRSAAAETSTTMNMGLLKLAAIDAARSAMQQLANDEDLTMDHLGEPWSGTKEFKDPSGITRMIHITDAERSFDVNNIAVPVTGSLLPPSEVLANILLMCGEFQSGQKLSNLRDWVDADTSGSRETPFYQEKNPPYQTPNRILYGWNELFFVEGWSPVLFESNPYRRSGNLFDAKLSDSVTIVPEPRSRIIPLNINTAGAAVLQAILGVGREVIVERIVTQRTQNPYRGISFLSDLLGREEFQNVAPYLDVKSHFFQIQATAYREGKSARIIILARRTDDGRVDAIQAAF